MNDLQHEFICQSSADLHSLAEKSRRHENEPLPADLLREIFCVLHTVKGTSQVFGLSAAADLAHTLENVLAAAKNDALSTEDTKLLAPQGIEILAKTLFEKNFQIPGSFLEKLQKYRSESVASESPSEGSPEIPEEFSASLSAQEKSLLNAALANDKNVCVLEIGFAAANFAEDFKNFRAALAEKGEIIAALPSARFAAENKIGFQIVYATGENIETIVENSAAQIIHQTRAVNSNDLSGVLAQIAEHGKTLARRLGKTVEFEIDADAETPPTPVLKIVFDALAHLVRNAVSHAFDATGKITIEAKAAPNGLILKVSDDGKGLDAEKIRRAAVEKYLVSTDENLSASEVTNLIFAPGFSTAETVSDVSGRGVGLDAVKTTAENAGGTISVQTAAGAGTTFEIFLPRNFLLQKHRDAEKENENDKN